MNDIQVLVATMQQNDFSLGKKMNILCNAVFANQADQNGVQVERTERFTWKMITTDTRGVGLNRNIALLAADADIILFADDDMTYYDGTLEGLKTAFLELPDADVIIFSVDLVKEGRIVEERRVPHKRMRLWNSMKYGTYAIAAKRKSILKANITFNHFFGGGCIYGSGEDSLFLKECFDKKLKVYSYNYVLGQCRKDTSSWFTGYNEKYFFDKGALFANLFPKWKILAAAAFAYKFRKSKIGFWKRFRLMSYGMRMSKTLISYEEAKELMN